MSLWTLKMAWRDTRNQRAKLVLYASSIILGVAALTALASFRQNVGETIEEQAKGLVGADLVLSSSEPINDEQEKLIDTLKGTRARETRFSTMIDFGGHEPTDADFGLQLRAQQAGRFQAGYGSLQ